MPRHHIPPEVLKRFVSIHREMCFAIHHGNRVGVSSGIRIEPGDELRWRREAVQLVSAAHGDSDGLLLLVIPAILLGAITLYEIWQDRARGEATT